MKSILQNTHLNSSVPINNYPQQTPHVTSSDHTPDIPHAVFALGNFFGNGDVFVKIPWQSLQLTKPLKSLHVDIFPTGNGPHKLKRPNAASLEIKRDASGCIKVTARKNLHDAMLLTG